MIKKKLKFVEIVSGVGEGCSSQISKKQHYVLNPIIVMKKRGFIPELWTLAKKGEKKNDSFHSIHVKRFSNTFSLLLHLFLDKRVKLVYCQLRPYLPSLLAPLSLKKCILMTQTYELGANWLTKLFSLFFMKRFDKIFALTPYERELYIKNGLRKERVVFSPHAIDYSFFHKKPKESLDKIRREYGIDKDDFVITSVANFRKFKNLDIIVGAFALFNKKIKKSRMLVVGKDQTNNPRYTEQLSKRYKDVEDVSITINREGIADRVIFTGGVDYKKVREILYISDVFVNSSDPEGMGMAVYEAASAGVPLCLSNIGSFTSVFKDMALYNPPRDKKKLAENYLRYYNNPTLRKRMGMWLKKHIKNWDYGIAMKRFDKIFSEVLD